MSSAARNAVAAPGARLAATFGAIHAQRMHGLPLLNEALRVEAVGFRRWDGRWLGALVTPWFINLVLLPDAVERWRSLPVRATATYTFPAGVFEFVGGYEPSLGEFQSCSLFSPVFEFASHEEARATAAAALDALFDAPTCAAATAAPTGVSKRDFLRGHWHGGSI